eukprot:TRINITY_DN11377_c0_g1_i1.p1 TRINITY_DN11377_c0_g1~~TRINITY_DN11377_c0_g1_i1.p1  ORF type:complete len:459 (-),score=40.29 TRINITY_DN11377_c0_g1_i1:62-1252(-)
MNLAGNQITEIPPEIGFLTGLTECFLNSNKIETIPEEIGFLTSLTILHFQSNHISSVPCQIGYATGLKQLYMEDNPIKNPPRNIFKKELSELLVYFRDIFNRNELCYKNKAIVLGGTHSGKAKLINELTKKRNVRLWGNSNIIVTHWTPKVKHPLLNPTAEMEICFLDCDKETHTKNNLFANHLANQDAAIFIVVVDLRKTESHIPHSFISCAKLTPNLVFIVGTFCDEVSSAHAQQVLEDCRSKYDGLANVEVKAVVATSSSKSNSMKAFREKLIDLNLRQYPGISVDQGVVLLTGMLLRCSEACVEYLSHAEFKRLAALNGIITKDKLKSGKALLRKWGVIHLHESCPDRVILSPSWLLSHLQKKQILNRSKFIASKSPSPQSKRRSVIGLHKS